MTEEDDSRAMDLLRRIERARKLARLGVALGIIGVSLALLSLLFKHW